MSRHRLNHHPRDMLMYIHRDRRTGNAIGDCRHLRCASASRSANHRSGQRVPISGAGNAIVGNRDHTGITRLVRKSVSHAGARGVVRSRAEGHKLTQFKADVGRRRQRHRRRHREIRNLGRTAAAAREKYSAAHENTHQPCGGNQPTHEPFRNEISCFWKTLSLEAADSFGNLRAPENRPCYTG